MKDLVIEGSLTIKDEHGAPRISLIADSELPRISLIGQGQSKIQILIDKTTSRVELTRPNGALALVIVVAEHSETIMLYDKEQKHALEISHGGTDKRNEIAGIVISSKGQPIEAIPKDYLDKRVGQRPQTQAD